MLRSDLCDYSDAYIIVKGTITVVRRNNTKRNKAVTFKNNEPFINCISKINGVKIDKAQDLGVVGMPMYNLHEYSQNYKKVKDLLWNYYRDRPTNPLYSNSGSFKYKTSIIESTYNIGDGEDGYDQIKVGRNKTELFIPVKYLSKFWRSLNIPLINFEVKLILTWSKNCVLSHPIFCWSLIYKSN